MHRKNRTLVTLIFLATTLVCAGAQATPDKCDPNDPNAGSMNCTKSQAQHGG